MRSRRFALRSYMVALVTLAVGLLCSIEFDDWSWFARSGSLVVVNGIILTSHQILEHMHRLGRYQRQRESQFNKDWAKDEKHDFIHDDAIYRWQSEKNGLYMLIGGTLIWGFGDLLQGIL